MVDFLETPVRYYSLVRGAPAPAAQEPALQTSPAPAASFEKVLAGVSVFLDRAVALQSECQRLEREAVAAAVEKHAAELKTRAAHTFAAIAAAAADLAPKAQSGEALPVDALRALNDVLKRSESRYGACIKSDVIPDSLLAAEPGSKLYPGLAKKVAAICGRGAGELESREIAGFEALLLQGGCDQDLDMRRSGLKSAMEQDMHRAILDHVADLSQSDHLPICETVPAALVPGRGELAVLSWNVLEFPRAGAPEPVLDGVNPYCDTLQELLGRKGKEARQILLGAMSSGPVVAEHSLHVLRVVRSSLENAGAAAALLQEVSGDLQPLLLELCREMGWAALFSAGSGDPKKCDAITAVISKEPFDEERQVEVCENKKVRRFAAGRCGRTGLVSCHVPLGTSKQAHESGEQVAARVVGHLLESLRGDGGADDYTFVFGGDWNCKVAELYRLVSDAPPGKGPCVSLHTTGGGTCMGCADGIDGILCLR